MEPRYDCDCDAVIGMEELGVGTEEILQYASATLPRESLRHLVRELETLLGEPVLRGSDADEESKRSAALTEAVG